MKSLIVPITIMLALSLIMLLSACEKGPAEKAGEKIDKAVENTKDKVEETLKK